MRRPLLYFVLAILLILVSCSEKAPAPPKEEIKTPVTDTPIEEEPDIAPTHEITEPEPEVTFTEVSSLTGLPISEEESLVRPVALVFNNHNKAHPQVGIGDADVVWEFNVEGGITRLLAIYSDISRVGVLGPVRSGRDYFLDIAEMYGAILVHAGGSDSFYREDKARDYDNIDEVNMHTIPQDTFWRNSEKRYSRGYEHSLETNGENLVRAFESQGYSLTQEKRTPMFPFAAERFTPDGTDAVSVTLKHSGYIIPRFTYDAESGKYYKESYDKPHVDEASGEQLSFDNVLILFASQRVVDEYLRLEIDLEGGGEGILITNGKSASVEWKNKNGRLSLEYSDGSPVLLNVGKTHITVFDEASKNGITIQ